MENPNLQLLGGVISICFQSFGFLWRSRGRLKSQGLPIYELTSTDYFRTKDDLSHLIVEAQDMVVARAVEL